MKKLLKFPEPLLVFKHGQLLEDPRDGLALFGPFDPGKPHGIKPGVIGTKEGIERFKRWLVQVQSFVTVDPPRRIRPPFPGFAAAFGIPLDQQPLMQLFIDDKKLHETIRGSDRHQAVYKTVELYAGPIETALRMEEDKPDLWFVVIPDDVYKYCRPQSSVEADEKVESLRTMNPREGRRAILSPFLFTDMNQDAKPYQFELDFRNQLKARLLSTQAVTQIIRESTLAYEDFVREDGKPIRDLKVLQSEIAWNMSSAAFYKAGGRPWKLAGVRDGVCYIGLVFKKVETNADPCSACCAAQMFLDSGDGVVFKGDVGPWYNPVKGDYHLKPEAAKKIITIALDSYKSRNDGRVPSEIFIHGKTWFNDEEWKSFVEAVPSDTKLVGVRIAEGDFKLFTSQDQPVMRGIAYIENPRQAYLWTKGYVPRLQTYPGFEVPKPLLINICRGEIDIEIVLRDVLGLTKLNYNSCRFADGLPVTLRFADAIGEILTCGPTNGAPPLRFSHYI